MQVAQILGQGTYLYALFLILFFAHMVYFLRGAARASWSLREEEPGAEHNKAGRGSNLTSKGLVPPKQHSKS